MDCIFRFLLEDIVNNSFRFELLYTDSDYAIISISRNCYILYVQLYDFTDKLLKSTYVRVNFNVIEYIISLVIKENY